MILLLSELVILPYDSTWINDGSVILFTCSCFNRDLFLIPMDSNVSFVVDDNLVIDWRLWDGL